MLLLKKFLLMLAMLAPVFMITAQTPKRYTSAEVYAAIQKLNFLGSVLYVAAHPDDENTRVISYLALERKAHVAYLSLTRGDGGQNLIGPEIRELLGLIRSQELLAARRIDGGKQLFSRANDFGFSKNPTETFQIWDRNAVLSDVVWAIRQWQPDVIINRFDHRTAGNTHGHHTASAILATEAFDLAKDPQAFPEQLQYTQTWQPNRLFFNLSWFFFGSQEAFDKVDKSKYTTLDAGVYFPALGKSNPEISAESRSMHKSQGFGSSGSRGSALEYLEFIKGQEPSSKTDLFAGINTTWTRVNGGAPIGKLVNEILQEYRYDQPGAVVPKLVKLYQLIAALPDGFWKRVKLAETQAVIQAALGLYQEAVSRESSAAPGDLIGIQLESINRSSAQVTLESVALLPGGIDSTFNRELPNNQRFDWFTEFKLPANLAYTNPYWLNEPFRDGMYTVNDQLLRGLPETPRQLMARFTYRIAGLRLSYLVPITYKDTDPVDGELHQPFEVIPAVFTKIQNKVYLFPNREAQSVVVAVRAGKSGVQGKVQLQVPSGWQVEPASHEFALARKGEEQNLRFQVTPPAQAAEGVITPLASVDGQTYQRELLTIKYKHIPTQTILMSAQAKVTRVELQKAGNLIGYLAGAGDDIPASLQQIGYKVDLLQEKDLSPENLSRYDAVILGVRAYNTIEALAFQQKSLLEYVRRGGTMLVQYNTNFELKVPANEIAPYALKISRDRVTDENAEMRILLPDHPVLNWPNKITAQDFSGWVQERGLYFPNSWDAQFAAILSCNDPGESPKNGGLLVATYGEGHYIYTGLAWFRQLPAGVPGAIRLFTNLISIGKNPKP